MTTTPYRLITRSNFDGLVCGILLKEKGLVTDIDFLQPKDIENNSFILGPKVITTNMPYSEKVYLAFDHHMDNFHTRDDERHIIDTNSPSAARVIYNYYGNKEGFPNIPDSLIKAADKCDAANLSKEDVINPAGWTLLNYLTDARTGLDQFNNFRVSNYDLMMELVEFCSDHTIEEILKLPDVQERIDFFDACQTKHREQIKRCAKVEGNLVSIDLRQEETIWPGNRFFIYTLFPQCNISVHILRARKNIQTVFAIGKSIFNRSSHTNVGELCLAFRGGGRENVGTCQVDHDMADAVYNAIASRIKMDG